MRGNKFGRQPSCQKRQANGRNTPRCKTRSKSTLRLLPWETKYQYTMLHFTSQSSSHHERNQNAFQNSSHVSDSLLESTPKHLSSSTFKESFRSDVDDVPEKMPEPKENLTLLKSKPNKHERSDHTHPKQGSVIGLNHGKQKYHQIKSKWYDDSFIKKLNILNSLVSVPMELKCKDGSVGNLLLENPENRFSQLGIERFVNGSFHYKTSDLDSLLDFNKE